MARTTKCDKGNKGGQGPQTEGATVALLSEVCCVCDRVSWGNIQHLGLGAWRHAECYAGSRNWIEAQRLKPEGKRSKLFPFFCSN